MSQRERNGGRRELTYSNWHRQDSISRFVSRYQAQFLYMADVDASELCAFCYRSIALIETTRFRGSFEKRAEPTIHLASDAGVPSYTVYFEADEPDSCGECGFWVPPWPDIDSFYVAGPLPSVDPPRPMTPAEFAQFLVQLRMDHAGRCAATREPWQARSWTLWASGAA